MGRNEGEKTEENCRNNSNMKRLQSGRKPLKITYLTQNGADHTYKHAKTKKKAYSLHYFWQRKGHNPRSPTAMNKTIDDEILAVNLSFDSFPGITVARINIKTVE